MSAIPNIYARQRRVQQLIRKWTRLLDLYQWKFGINFNIEGEAAACSADPEYRMAALNFNLAKITDSEEETFVIHELLHCHIWELAHTAQTLADEDKAKLEWVRLCEERLTTTLETIIFNLASHA